MILMTHTNAECASFPVEVNPCPTWVSASKDDSHVEIALPDLPTRIFEFDSVFQPESEQSPQQVAEIFEDCRDLVQSAVDGHNVTVMTYGQTGAGKILVGNWGKEDGM